MSLLTIEYNILLRLLNDHCEPIDCNIKNCATCQKIEQSRFLLNGNERKQYQKKNPKYIYTVTEAATRKKYTFDSLRESSHLIGVAENTALDLLRKQREYNGYFISRVDKKECVK